MSILEQVLGIFKKSGKPIPCASCGTILTRKMFENAVACEVWGENGPAYVVCCSELCLARVNKHGLQELVMGEEVQT